MNFFYLLSKIAEIAQSLRNERKQEKMNFETKQNKKKFSSDTENNPMRPEYKDKSRNLGTPFKI